MDWTRSKIQGVGVGLRQPHLPEILRDRPGIPWFEVLVDNYLGKNNPAFSQLEQVRAHYPIVFHGVGMNLGSVDPLDEDYLGELKDLMARLEPEWISDHLCWTAVNGRHHHDLLPLPYTDEVISYVSERIQRVQEFLGQGILIENVSSYIRYRDSEMEEWEFLSEIARRADCRILLDINNIYVTAKNHRFSPQEYLQSIPQDRVGQFHLAGYEEREGLLVDTHGAPISKEVWEWYGKALEHFGPIPTLIERDNAIPDFPELWREVKEAEQWMKKVL